MKDETVGNHFHDRFQREYHHEHVLQQLLSIVTHTHVRRGVTQGGPNTSAAAELRKCIAVKPANETGTLFLGRHTLFSKIDSDKLVLCRE